MAFLFLYFKERKSVPSIFTLRLAFPQADPDDSLQRFFIDLYDKWSDNIEIPELKDWSKSMYPAPLLLRMVTKRCAREGLLGRQKTDDTLVLKLADYHGSGSEKFCPTKGKDTGDTYIIS